MASHILIFSLTPNEFMTRVAMLIGQGVIITGDSGTIEHSGVTLAYSYNGVDTMTVTIVHKPFIIPEGTVENAITKWFLEPPVGDPTREQ